MQRLFTSESVTEGHPDKICDQISDSVLDAILAQDKKARVACDVAVNTGIVLVMGEITTSGYVDMQKVARDTIRRIGYVGGRTGFDADNCGVLVCIDGQSPDIAQGVDDALESRGQGVFDIGAGDQGMMFGYACNETDTFMPYAITAAHDLTRRLAYVRKQGILDFVLPDGKAQVTVEYDEASRPRRIDTVVVSSQHVEEVSYADLKEGIYEEVIKKTLDPTMLDRDTKILINPTGRFVVGGPRATPASRAERSSSTPTAATAGTAAAHSRARTRQRWTAARPMRRGMWPRTSWRRASRTSARSSSPTRLAWRTR